MKRVLSVLTAAGLSVIGGMAQEVGGYGFLELPVSPHAAALGGNAISVVEPEASLSDQNPSLLCPEMAGQVNFSYMNYVSDINLCHASYTGLFRGEGTWQTAIRMVSYGDFTGYDADGNATGTFGARDISVSAGWGYPVNDKLRVGASVRSIISKYDTYSAFAMGVDVGLNYYDEASGRSISAVLSNVGGQLKSLENRRAHLPTQLTVGLSKEVEHLPFCFTLTAIDLLDWKQNYLSSTGEEHRYTRAEQVLAHLLWGVEWLASDHFFIAGGYSLRRQQEFSGEGGFLRGLSLGTGIQLGYWQVQASYASYNAVDGSLMVGLSYQF